MALAVRIADPKVYCFVCEARYLCCRVKVPVTPDRFKGSFWGHYDILTHPRIISDLLVLRAGYRLATCRAIFRPHTCLKSLQVKIYCLTSQLGLADYDYCESQMQMFCLGR